jgi:hypothetical protein
VAELTSKPIPAQISQAGILSRAKIQGRNGADCNQSSNRALLGLEETISGK